MWIGHAQHCHLPVTPPGDLPRRNDHRRGDCQLQSFDETDHGISISGALWHINEVKMTWLHIVAHFGENLSVTWLIYRSHRRTGRSTNFLTAVTYGSQSNIKSCLQKNNFVQKSPVEVAQLHLISPTNQWWFQWLISHWLLLRRNKYYHTLT